MTPEESELSERIKSFLEEKLACGLTDNPDDLRRLENEIRAMLLYAHAKGILQEVSEVHVVPNPLDPSGLLILDAEEYQVYCEEYPRVL